MASFHLCCVLGVICCLLSVVNTLWDKRGAVKVERRDSHRLYPPRNFPENLSYAFLCHFATDKFVSALDMAVQQLNTYHRPLLVHTRDEVRRCWWFYLMGGIAGVWVGLHAAKYMCVARWPSTPLYSDQMCFCTLEKMLKTLQYLFQHQDIVIYR